jgi:hypothetical protein
MKKSLIRISPFRCITLLALPENIRQGYKITLRINALAYFQSTVQKKNFFDTFWVLHSKGRLLALPTNVRPDRKVTLRAPTL